MTPDRSIVVQVPDDKHRAVRIKAAEMGVTISDIVRALVYAWLRGEIDIPIEVPPKEEKE